jgi:hypothetical protein
MRKTSRCILYFIPRVVSLSKELRPSGIVGDRFTRAQPAKNKLTTHRKKTHAHKLMLEKKNYFAWRHFEDFSYVFFCIFSTDDTRDGNKDSFFLRRILLVFIIMQTDMRHKTKNCAQNKRYKKKTALTTSEFKSR